MNREDPVMADRTKPVVVKIGGSTLGAHDTSVGDIARLHRAGQAMVVVHGGGALITQWLERMQVASEFAEGLRKTTAESRDVVVAVLAGLVNKRLVRELQERGAAAVGVSGVDGGLLRSAVSAGGLGLVGDAPVCAPALLESLLRAGHLPVVAPVGLSADGREILNINADSAAGAVAVALRAQALVFLTDVPGILDAQGQVLVDMDADGVAALRATGTIRGGMLPKVTACQEAAAAGVLARIVDGRETGAISMALQGSHGTLVR